MNNEELKRRFTGLALITLILFLLSWALPRPGELSPAGDNVQRVTLDLQAPDIHDGPSPPSTPVPPVIEAPRSAAPDFVGEAAVTAEPDIEEPPQPAAVSSVAPKSGRLPATKPVVRDSSKAVAGIPRVSAPPLTSESGTIHWYVQLGAFSDVANARQLLQQYKAQKFPGILSPADTPKGTRYRVRIGPYAKREQAVEAQKRMVKAGATGTALIGE